MTDKLPFKPLSDPRHMVVPKPTDGYFSRRNKRKRIQRRRQIEAQLNEEHDDNNQE